MNVQPKKHLLYHIFRVYADCGTILIAKNLFTTICTHF